MAPRTLPPRDDRRYIHSTDLIEQVRELWEKGLTVAKIAREQRLTPGKVVGIAHRNRFPARPSPIKRRD